VKARQLGAMAPSQVFLRAPVMNPIKEIGRYKLPILNVVVVIKRDDGEYDAQLTNGQTIRFTEEEKKAYDKEIETHELVMNLYGACVGGGLRPRP
jgi:hypothetical protein